jgi:hypothetical protein
VAAAIELEADEMTEQMTKVFFKSSDGVHEVLLPANEAVLAAIKHPIEWSLTRDGHAPAPERFVFSSGNGGGIGLRGTSIRDPRD